MVQCFHDQDWNLQWSNQTGCNKSSTVIAQAGKEGVNIRKKNHPLLKESLKYRIVPVSGFETDRESHVI